MANFLAVDTSGSLLALRILFIERGDRVVVLHYGSILGVNGNSHHRSAVHYLTGLLGVAADRLDNVADLSADRSDNVSGGLYSRAVNGKALFNEGHTRSEIFCNECNGGNVHNENADVRGELALGNYTSDGIINKYLFSSLRISVSAGQKS